MLSYIFHPICNGVSRTGLTIGFFTHLTEGSITEQSVAVKTNPLYPWLDDTSFNKWFVPRGETTVLSKLPITKADKHDIRKGSVGAHVKFLGVETYHRTASLNKHMG